jgi:hypothetical protein
VAKETQSEKKHENNMKTVLSHDKRNTAKVYKAVTREENHVTKESIETQPMYFFDVLMHE